MSQNVSFLGAEFTLGDSKFLTEVKEAQNAKALADIESFKGEMVYVGLADKDFDAETAARIQGKVALIDRGAVSFADKIKRAVAAGASAVVVANNAAGEAIVMANDNVVEIPAVMIEQEAGQKIKVQLATSSVVVDLKPAQKIEKPWMADTISPFSSRGPRSEDGVIKPEISAPGTNIISAARGSGDRGRLMSGTSMAGPHIAGVMGLLRQKFPELSVLELKSVLLGHGKVINDEKKAVYSVSRQGAGRVQVAESLSAKLVTIPSTISLGLVDIEQKKVLTQDLTIKNISNETLSLDAQWAGSNALRFKVPKITLAAGESKKVTIQVLVDGTQMTEANQELDGFLKFTRGEETLLQMPALAVTRQISRITATSLHVAATSEDDGPGSLAILKLKNTSMNAGEAYVFTSLGKDDRKVDEKPDLAHNKNCDLQSAGYRIIQGEDGKRYFQVALKLYEGVTTWHRCEVNVQFDSNNDGVADQELDGLVASDLPGLTTDKFISLLLDGNKARELRKQYETDKLGGKEATEDYKEAIQGMLPMDTFDNSTLAIITAEVSSLQASPTGELKVKISTTHNDSAAVEYDDYLGSAKEWKQVSLNDLGQAVSDIPEVVKVDGNSTSTVNLKKGYSNESVIIYTPQNKSVRDSVVEDQQSQVLKATYGVK
jgi:hypothetical protein